MMNTLLPGLRVSEGHVNHTSETTKSRNHQKRKCGKAITIVLCRQRSLRYGCKMLHILWHNKQYVTTWWFRMCEVWVIYIMYDLIIIYVSNCWSHSLYLFTHLLSISVIFWEIFMWFSVVFFSFFLDFYTNHIYNIYSSASAISACRQFSSHLTSILLTWKVSYFIFFSSSSSWTRYSSLIQCISDTPSLMSLYNSEW